MSRPWEKYAKTSGPWTKYGASPATSDQPKEQSAFDYLKDVGSSAVKKIADLPGAIADTAGMAAGFGADVMTGKVSGSEMADRVGTAARGALDLIPAGGAKPGSRFAADVQGWMQGRPAADVLAGYEKDDAAYPGARVAGQMAALAPLAAIPGAGTLAGGAALSGLGSLAMQQANTGRMDFKDAASDVLSGFGAGAALKGAAKAAPYAKALIPGATEVGLAQTGPQKVQQGVNQIWAGAAGMNPLNKVQPDDLGFVFDNPALRRTARSPEGVANLQSARAAASQDVNTFNQGVSNAVRDQKTGARFAMQDAVSAAEGAAKHGVDEATGALKAADLEVIDFLSRGQRQAKDAIRTKQLRVNESANRVARDVLSGADAADAAQVAKQQELTAFLAGRNEPGTGVLSRVRADAERIIGSLDAQDAVSGSYAKQLNVALSDTLPIGGRYGVEGNPGALTAGEEALRLKKLRGLIDGLTPAQSLRNLPMQERIGAQGTLSLRKLVDQALKEFPDEQIAQAIRESDAGFSKARGTGRVLDKYGRTKTPMDTGPVQSVADPEKLARSMAKPLSGERIASSLERSADVFADPEMAQKVRQVLAESQEARSLSRSGKQFLSSPAAQDPAQLAEFLRTIGVDAGDAQALMGKRSSAQSALESTQASGRSSVDAARAKAQDTSRFLAGTESNQPTELAAFLETLGVGKPEDLRTLAGRQAQIADPGMDALAKSRALKLADGPVPDVADLDRTAAQAKMQRLFNTHEGASTGQLAGQALVQGGVATATGGLSLLAAPATQPMTYARVLDGLVSQMDRVGASAGAQKLKALSDFVKSKTTLSPSEILTRAVQLGVPREIIEAMQQEQQ